MKIAKLREKLLGRFMELIAEAEQLYGPVVEMRKSGGPYSFLEIDYQKFIEWRTKAITLLFAVVPSDHIHHSAIKPLPNWDNPNAAVEWAIPFLKGLMNDLEEGFFDSIAYQIEAQIYSDYMGQAEELIAEGQTGRFDHVPAAVLAGAVFEKGLRTLCSRQKPEIPTVNAKGEHKTLNPLIDDLKKAGVFNELRAKQLRAWADVRNKAAHGEFDQFTRVDVEQMLKGITAFLAENLG